MHLPSILIGNKKDLKAQRQVSKEEANLLAESWGVPYKEISAKVYTKPMVAQIFDILVRNILEKDQINDGVGKGSVLDWLCQVSRSLLQMSEVLFSRELLAVSAESILVFINNPLRGRNHLLWIWGLHHPQYARRHRTLSPLLIWPFL